MKKTNGLCRSKDGSQACALVGEQAAGRSRCGVSLCPADALTAEAYDIKTIF
ncbi:MAG: hypothetical protein AAFW82_00840 [Pseudomonadota bacterium]